jgi:hypothetical protein
MHIQSTVRVAHSNILDTRCLNESLKQGNNGAIELLLFVVFNPPKLRLPPSGANP